MDVHGRWAHRKSMCTVVHSREGHMRRQRLRFMPAKALHCFSGCVFYCFKPLMKVLTLLLTREHLRYRMFFAQYALLQTPAPHCVAPDHAALTRGRRKAHVDHFLHTAGTDGHLCSVMLGRVTQGGPMTR